MTGPSPLVTVVFLLYNAQRSVRALAEALARQRRPQSPAQADWLRALFMDDASRDDTLAALDRALVDLGHPTHWEVVRNERNLGLAGTLNKAIALAKTPYILSCHLDCLFGEEAYVSRMVDLMEGRADAGAITGKPTIAAGADLPFAEKVNLAANLMDILPADTEADLVAVGFAEGRCDIFRKAALEAAGFYDTTLRTAGEDQVLAARMRARGFEVYQAPHLPYFLSVSDEQDTVTKLLRHQQLFGRAHPYILLRTRHASRGVASAEAGANRRLRLVLRLQQVASLLALGGALALALLGHALAAAAALAAVLMVKLLIFRRHLAAVGFGFGERLGFFALQPALDAAYSWGLAQGLSRIATGSPQRPID
jgi:GT2 family glycosyltransferase